MIEAIGLALFVGCVVAAFLIPIIATIIFGERIYYKVNPQEKKDKTDE